MQKVLWLVTALVMLSACKTDVPPAPIAPVTTVTPQPDASPPAPPPVVPDAAAAHEPATETCNADTDCVLSTFPGCCSCCECGKLHAVTRSVDAASREACTRKDCPSCKQLDYKCIPCKDPAKEGMRARCEHGACILVETSAAPAPTPTPDGIACKTVDDCWFDESRAPIARPKNLRGKKITPCKGGHEHAPACRDGVCSVIAYKC